MPEHNPKIKILNDEELAFAIKACEEKAMWPIVACLRELCQFRKDRSEMEIRLKDAFDAELSPGALNVVELKIQLDKDRRSKI